MWICIGFKLLDIDFHDDVECERNVNDIRDILVRCVPVCFCIVYFILNRDCFSDFCDDALVPTELNCFSDLYSIESEYNI